MKIFILSYQRTTGEPNSIAYQVEDPHAQVFHETLVRCVERANEINDFVEIPCFVEPISGGSTMQSVEPTFNSAYRIEILPQTRMVKL